MESAVLFNHNHEQTNNDGFITTTDPSGATFLHRHPLLDGYDAMSVLQSVDTNCTPAAILDFPPDGLTRDERRSGWIVVHVLIACYAFWLIAIVCDDYFVPVIDSLCESAWSSRLVERETRKHQEIINSLFLFQSCR